MGGMIMRGGACVGEIMMMDGYVVVYRNNVDVFFYVVGSAEENELLLGGVLNAFYDAVQTILK